MSKKTHIAYRSFGVTQLACGTPITEGSSYSQYLESIDCNGCKKTVLYKVMQQVDKMDKKDE